MYKVKWYSAAHPLGCNLTVHTKLESIEVTPAITVLANMFPRYTRIDIENYFGEVVQSIYPGDSLVFKPTLVSAGKSVIEI